MTERVKKELAYGGDIVSSNSPGLMPQDLKNNYSQMRSVEAYI